MHYPEGLWKAGEIDLIDNYDDRHRGEDWSNVKSDFGFRQSPNVSDVKDYAFADVWFPGLG